MDDCENDFFLLEFFFWLMFLYQNPDGWNAQVWIDLFFMCSDDSVVHVSIVTLISDVCYELLL